MPDESNSDLALVVADPRRILDLQAEDVPPLLGALEQLRSSLWTQMLRAPTSPTRESVIDAGDQLLTVPEVAAELKFTRSYVYEAVRRRDLSAIRKGKYVRIRRADLRAWLDGRTPRTLDARPATPDSSRHAPNRSGPKSPRRTVLPASRRAQPSTPSASKLTTT